MVKLLRIFLVLLVLALVGAGAGAYWVWRQATQAPDWVQTEVPPVQAPTVPLERLVERKLEEQGAAAGQTATITLKSQELQTWAQSAVAEQLPPQTPLPPLQTRVSGETLEIGAVIPSQDLSQFQLPPRHQALLDRLAGVLPQGEQALYVGLKGRPRLEGQHLVFDDQTQIQVGRLTLSVADVARRLNLSPTQLQSALRLPLGAAPLEDFQIDGEAVRLKVTDLRR
ncbi:MAG: hypothetical protein GC158_14310 [Cyanobacteria bacterium RI_101]|nr:hypothetical protein [Cyanobacteria bacterium RI_101]